MLFECFWKMFSQVFVYIQLGYYFCYFCYWECIFELYILVSYFYVNFFCLNYILLVLISKIFMCDLLLEYCFINQMQIYKYIGYRQLIIIEFEDKDIEFVRLWQFKWLVLYSDDSIRWWVLCVIYWNLFLKIINLNILFFVNLFFIIFEEFLLSLRIYF